MASNNMFLAKTDNIADFIPLNDPDNLFEFSDPDFFINNRNHNAVSQLDAKKTLLSHTSRKGGRNMVVDIKGGRTGTCSSSSLPVNIPDWSKNIYRDDHHDKDSDQYDDEKEGRVPPHEYLTRRREAPLSVHEGIGRTLKGRDLRQVRNAIWKKVGFED